MKPTHLTTPRSLDECHFLMNADPIEVYVSDGYDWQDKVVMVGAAVAAVALIAILWVS